MTDPYRVPSPPEPEPPFPSVGDHAVVFFLLRGDPTWILGAVGRVLFVTSLGGPVLFSIYAVEIVGNESRRRPYEVWLRAEQLARPPV